MNDDVRNLVEDVVELLDAPPPGLLAADAPVLAANTAASDAPYFIGLIGGKDVGKSSLVNALVGQPISKASNAGEGTATAIAYCHADIADEVRTTLRNAIGEQFELVTHRIGAQRRQVLLDLPDIDSLWQQHVQLTRSMLRHMLFPIWLQSVEKYADRAPQQLLTQVAEGNDPANFVFCLNKIDLLVAREGEAAANELRDDFAQRLARTLKLPLPPRVHLISATHAEQFDLPKLRDAITTQRSERSVESSLELATQRQRSSMLGWLDAQGLNEIAARSQRSLDAAEELVSARLAVPLTESIVPRIASDPVYRLDILEPVMSRRMARWPIVNVIQTTLSPLMLLIKKNLSPARSIAATGSSTAAMIATHINSEARPLSDLIQATFAQLRQTDESIAVQFDRRRLWEDSHADHAAADLQRQLAATIDRQREEAVARLAVRGGVLTAPIRWVLTIGAALWFPLIQPILEHALTSPLTMTIHAMALLVVPLLGAMYLLHSAAFLVLWFAALWMFLRWQTNRRVNRLIAKWSRSMRFDDELSLQTTCLNWVDKLLEPMRLRRSKTVELSERLIVASSKI